LDSLSNNKVHHNSINFLNPEHVQLAGLLSARYSGNLRYLRHIFGTRKEWMLEPFQNIGKEWIITPLRDQKMELSWAGEYAGKWLDAAALVAASTNDQDLRQNLEEFSFALIATQQPDGYLGIEPPAKQGQGWDVWNSWNVMVGLLTYYEHFKKEDVLDAAVRCGKWVIEHFGVITDFNNPFFREAHDENCNSPIVGEFVRLYTFTQDQRFLDFAASIINHNPLVETIRSKNGAPLIHVYHLTEFLAGVVDYAIAINHSDILQWVETAWKDMVDHHLYPTGSLGYREHLRETAPNDIPVENGEPDKHHQETCGTVGWLLLNSKLFQATGKACYMHRIEQTLYNALLAAQSTDGMSWMYYTPLRYEKRWFTGPTSCCYWSGPRGIARIVNWIYAYNNDGIFINLYESSHASVNISGNSVSLTQTTSFPETGHVALRLQPEKPFQFTLWLRVPEYSISDITINDGFFQAKPDDNGYLSIRRVWTPGDLVEIKFDLPVVAKPFIQNNYGVIFRGPEVLAIDQRDNPALDLDSVMLTKDAKLKNIHPEGGRRRYRGEIKSDGKWHHANFTPYADAGEGGARFRTAFPID